MCATTPESTTARRQQQQQQQQQQQDPTEPPERTRQPSAATEPQRQQRQSRRTRRRYPQLLHEGGDEDECDSSSAAAVEYYVPPPAFVVRGNSSSSLVEGTTKTKKFKNTTAPGACALTSLASSAVSSSAPPPSLTSSETSSSSSSSSRDDRIRAKWIEMRAKDRKTQNNSSSSLERMMGGTGGSGGGARRGRGSDDDSCDTMMMMTTIVDDASDATLKVDNSNTNNNSGSSGGAAGAVAAMGATYHPHLYSTPIFEATLVAEPYDDDVDHRDESKVPDVRDPLEIMERARAVARQELLREAVTATAVIPIGDDEEDNNVDKDSDATSSSSSSSADPNSSSSKVRASRRRKRWVRGAILGAVLIVLWAAVAWAVAYFVSPRSGSSSTTPTRPPASQTGSTSLNSTTSPSSSTTTLVKYGAVSDEALGLSADGSVLAIGTLNAASMGQGGVVRVLRRSGDKSNNNNTTTSTAWIERGVVTDDGMPYFGFAVGVAGSGQRLVVGAPGGVEIGDPDVVVPGSVRVYDYDATMNMWESPYADLTGLSRGGLFGHSVAISGDASTVAAGAPSADGMGMAQVWKLNNETRQWEQRGQDLSIDVLDSHFGESTALSNDGHVLVVGGCGANAVGASGSVVPYQFDADTDMWLALGSPLLGNASMERWGWDVTVSGDGNVVASSANVFSSRNPGSVHVYRYNEGANEWEPYGEALVGQLHDRFGYTVSLSHDGTKVAVGAPGEKGSGTGSVQVYAFDKYTHSWSPTLSPHAARGTSATDDLGEAVALSSDGTYVAASSSTGGYTEVFELN